MLEICRLSSRCCSSVDRRLCVDRVFVQPGPRLTRVLCVDGLLEHRCPAIRTAAVISCTYEGVPVACAGYRNQLFLAQIAGQCSAWAFCEACTNRGMLPGHTGRHVWLFQESGLVRHLATSMQINGIRTPKSGKFHRPCPRSTCSKCKVLQVCFEMWASTDLREKMRSPEVHLPPANPS